MSISLLSLDIVSLSLTMDHKTRSVIDHLFNKSLQYKNAMLYNNYEQHELNQRPSEIDLMKFTFHKDFKMDSGSKKDLGRASDDT